jgi:hypothetical protein
LTSDSEMVSTHDHLHMNLTGHTLKGFLECLKAFINDCL